MSKTLKTRVKTKYQDLVWVHSKYIDNVMDGGTLIIVHDGQEMTVTRQSIEEIKPVKGKEKFTEQWGIDRGEHYFLYGFVFESDQPSLFSL